MIVTEEFQGAVRQWLAATRHRQFELARLAKCDPSTITRILRQPGKRLEDAIAGQICQLIDYNTPPSKGLCQMVLDRLECAIGLSSEARVLYINAAMARLLGRPAEQLAGHDILDLVPPDQKPSVQDRIMARDPAPYDVTLLTPQGPKRFHIVPEMLTSHIRMVRLYPLPPADGGVASNESDPE